MKSRRLICLSGPQLISIRQNEAIFGCAAKAHQVAFKILYHPLAFVADSTAKTMFAPTINVGWCSEKPSPTCRR